MPFYSLFQIFRGRSEIQMGLFKKLFGTYSEKEIKKITATVDKIEALADRFAALSDEEMRGYTAKLKDELAAGKTLDDILPEAYALVREADDRVLGKRPFRVQLMGGILLHQGRIAEMKTGEGKTLVATLPAYLNALTGIDPTRALSWREEFIKVLSNNLPGSPQPHL